jgi:hypothetical protein
MEYGVRYNLILDTLQNINGMVVDGNITLYGVRGGLVKIAMNSFLKVAILPGHTMILRNSVPGIL